MADQAEETVEHAGGVFGVVVWVVSVVLGGDYYFDVFEEAEVGVELSS